MTEIERRAIVWDTIERIAFQPRSDNDRDRWLGVFARTLHALWGMDQMWIHLAQDDEFLVYFLNLKCDYYIESLTKYSTSLADIDSGSCAWGIQVEPNYLSKASLHSAPGRYPHQERAHLQRDIEAVLDGMLFHPRCHAHLEDLGIQYVELDQNRAGLSSHEVRVGGGIENPYVFLFHLRYQFCLVADEVRRYERARLVDLFKRSIRNNQYVPARDLFNF